jgi:hypothetical protein
MKNFIWILMTALTLTQCTNENTNTTETQEVADTTTTSTEPGHYKASPDSPLIGLWVTQFALGSPNVDKDELSKEFEGRWHDLKADNTFESGRWQEKTNSGTWIFDPETRIIQLNYTQTEPVGNEWKIQGDANRMVWLGNTPNNRKGTQLKLTKETAKPQAK